MKSGEDENEFKMKISGEKNCAQMATLRKNNFFARSFQCSAILLRWKVLGVVCPLLSSENWCKVLKKLTVHPKSLGRHFRSCSATRGIRASRHACK